jgi:hypothetical protein
MTGAAPSRRPASRRRLLDVPGRQSSGVSHVFPRTRKVAVVRYLHSGGSGIRAADHLKARVRAPLYASNEMNARSRDALRQLTVTAFRERRAGISSVPSRRFPSATHGYFRADSVRTPDT